MKPRLLAGLTGLALAAVLLGPTAAFATDTETVHFRMTDVQPDTNPCSGASGTLTVDLRGVSHITTLDNGTYHETSTATGTFRFVPNDASQPTYSGHATFWDGENQNLKSFTATFTGSIILHGSDGSLLKLQLLSQVTVNANGTVTSSIETERLTCR